MNLERMSKGWTSYIYAFYKPDPLIDHIEGRRCHIFLCAKPGCQSRQRRYLDGSNRTGTGNMHKHAKRCWGLEAVRAAEKVGTKDGARSAVDALKRDGSIKAAFANISKRPGVQTYSTRPHTREESK